jgi:NADPH-dependent 2,4-dienoyl-CoA reductase/sulfur reductase-like enzyme/rhodanese-related sulfurtransferase
MSQPQRVVIIGGVAGGMSCATRVRRLSEAAQITVLERGAYPSFANCGLPYHIGGEIEQRGKLLVQTPENLLKRFNLDVRVLNEATAIDRERKVVSVRRVESGETYELPYDALVLAMGAGPLRPRIPGIDRAGLFTLRNITDMDAINAWIADKAPAQAVVVGGGYIGLEMAEQLARRGLKITVVEALPQVMAPLDPEMAELLHAELHQHQIDLVLGDAVAGFEDGATAGQTRVVLKSGRAVDGGLVILGLGVRPDVELARAAGLELGERGGLRVDEHLRTSDPAIYAVGDAIEVRDRMTDQWAVIPLAGPANRQGRIAADNMFGIASAYHATQGTAVLRLFELTAACTGANEKTLRRNNLPYEAVHLHPASHASYFPGAQPMALKMLFNPADGKLLGAQAVGRDGVDKRIDVFATALAAGMTVDDLAELELAYAPPFGSAKDPVNLAGMIGQNIRAGLVRQIQWDEVAALDPATHQILDLRDPGELAAGRIPNSINIPLPELRGRLAELPRDKTIIAHCASGQRSYFATRVLTQHGFKVRNLSGSFKTWQMGQATLGRG